MAHPTGCMCGPCSRLRNSSMTPTQKGFVNLLAFIGIAAFVVFVYLHMA